MGWTVRSCARINVTLGPLISQVSREEGDAAIEAWGVREKRSDGKLPADNGLAEPGTAARPAATGFARAILVRLATGMGRIRHLPIALLILWGLCSG